MVMLCARALDPGQLALFMTWWATVTLLVTAFGVFEVYLARAWMAARAAGGPTERVVAQLGGQLMLLVGAIAALAWVLAGPLADALFDGERWAVLMIPFYGATWAVLALQRGVATGQLRFAVVGGQLAAEGILRVVLVAVALTVTGPDASTVGLAVVLAGLMAVALTGAALRGWLVRPAPLLRELPVVPLLWLLLGAVGPVLVGNVGVPWLAWAMPDDPILLAAFAGAMTLSRVPTQFVSAVFSPMMAALAQAVDQDDSRRHDLVLSRALRLSLTLGGIFVAMCFLVGPLVLALYLGPSYQLPRWVLGLLGLASALVLLATIQQASLAAHLRWTSIAGAWALGTLVFGAVLVLPMDPVLRAAVAPVAAAATAVAVNAVRLRMGRRAGARAVP
jgi:O-antigen/teichoic acid export membrane protein